METGPPLLEHHAGARRRRGVGFLTGAAFGVIAVGTTLLVWAHASSPWWVLGLVSGWCACAGSIAGGFIGVMRAGGFSESLPLTYSDEPLSPLWVAVFGDQERRAIVEATAPIHVVDGDRVRT